MAWDDTVVLRFNDGKVLKGYLKGFSQESQEVMFEELGKTNASAIPVREMKAIFFVKTFEGDNTRREIKRYGLGQNKGKKIFVKFKDEESVIGYLHEDVPWDKGFFLSRPDNKKTGFFLIPVDEDSNNIKIFVIRSSVKDITAVP